MYELGMLYLKEQRLDEARQYLQQLVDDFPESPYIFTARQRLSELG
jgi:TolA-binding protein